MRVEVENVCGIGLTSVFAQAHHKYLRRLATPAMEAGAADFQGGGLGRRATDFASRCHSTVRLQAKKLAIALASIYFDARAAFYELQREMVLPSLTPCRPGNSLSAHGMVTGAGH